MNWAGWPGATTVIHQDWTAAASCVAFPLEEGNKLVEWVEWVEWADGLGAGGARHAPTSRQPAVGRGLWLSPRCAQELDMIHERRRTRCGRTYLKKGSAGARVWMVEGARAGCSREEMEEKMGILGRLLPAFPSGFTHPKAHCGG